MHAMTESVSELAKCRSIFTIPKITSMDNVKLHDTKAIFFQSPRPGDKDLYIY